MSAFSEQEQSNHHKKKFFFKVLNIEPQCKVLEGKRKTNVHKADNLLEVCEGEVKRKKQSGYDLERL